MQNVAQGNAADSPKIAENITITSSGNGEPNGGPTTGRTTLTTAATPLSSNSSPAKSETETYSEHRRFMSDTSESEEDSVSEEFEEDPQVEAAKFLLSAQEDRSVDPETQARLEALLKAAGISQFATKDGKHLADPEVLRRLTSSVSCALDEAAAALTRMRSDSTRGGQSEKTSLVEACTDGDVGTVRKLLTEGRSVHETSEEGESLLSLACSAGYYELAQQVLLAMHANVEDRGIKGECTPLMEAASAGHLDIVRLLVVHGADVNAQSTSGNTPLMYGCAGGHQDVVKFLLENGANVEDHNENGHTPLMEAASAGHVGLAKILLEHGAGINTHSNEFKESALTLACYKGHLDMVKFLLEAGADQEHKTDEMHTALMEASMDGHVEVARLLLDSGAQVNMPTDSFESPLTLAACGGHVDLALLLIERGANIEEVNDEGYTPLMEAAREGHEEMVSLLLSQGANINAQTDETQETALTLACCGGFTEVADFLLKAGADIDLGASTPLMEAAQEGHLELVKYLLENNATVHAQTQTGDTALSYACENGHTDVADLLLQYGADLEHESEGGRTPLMKACRAGHLCTVQFLISKGADVRRQTSNNDHTPLSLACAGGHLSVVELLLTHRADPNHKLKDNSTMLIEAAKGGHTAVVQLLLDYPHSMNSMMLNQQGAAAAAAATNLSILPGQVGSRDSPLPSTLPQPISFFQPPPNILGSTVLQEVPEAVRIITQEEASTSVQDMTKLVHGGDSSGRLADIQHQHHHQQAFDGSLTSAEAQQVRTQPVPVAELEDHDVFATSATVHFLSSETERLKDDEIDEGGDQKKQQILEELHQVDREFLGKQQTHNHLLLSQYAVPPEQCQQTANTSLPHTLNIDIAMQQQQGLGTSMPGTMFSSSNLQVHNAFYTGATCLQSPGVPLKLAVGNESNSGFAPAQAPPTFYFAPLNSSVAVPLSSATTTSAAAAPVQQPVKVQTVASHAEVNQSTAISDRPKAKPVSKKDCKNLRKQPYQPNLYGAAQPLLFPQPLTQTQPNSTTQTQQQTPQQNGQDKLSVVETLNVQQLDLETLDQTFDLKDEAQENLLTAQILHQIHNSPQLNSIRAAFVGSPVQSYPTTLDETMIATLAAHQQEPTPTDVSRVEYFAVPTGNTTQLQVQHTLYPYEHYLPGVGLGTVGTISNKEQSGAIYQAGFQAGINLMQQQLACPTVSSTDTVTTATVIPATLVPATVATIQGTAAQYNTQTLPTSCTHGVVPPGALPTHHCQVPCTGQHHHQSLQVQAQQQQQQQAHQVQAATQTQPSNVVNDGKRQTKSVGSQDYSSSGGGGGKKKGKMLYRHQNQNQTQQNGGIQQGQGNQIDPNAVNQYTGTPSQGCQMAVAVPPPGYCMDVDSETESNHDTALTLACAGGHEELVELLLQRGADIEHRDKKGFTPLILAATAGHEKVVEILLNHSADLEAQSERTKDTPLSLACSGGRYEVVELLLNRNANKEHRNVSDYTPLSLAASGGYVNIIKLLLNNGAEINSRTGSKLGISPLMLAAMNGHTAAVKLLLDMGSDINAQIETNRNTALTLACFQGRHEVVSLLLDRKANVEHRAKTGLTPLMEAASGGYVEVGRVLLDKGADVNATPVPSSRDTALTIAADKGHVRFVELLLCRGASVEVKNKKGNSPLWLAANGGHLSVVELLYNLNADIDSQDNRKVSCLMAAFRKGHVKVVKWMVNHVTQFPSDQEMIRYYSTISDKELLDKCQEGVNIIRAAKDTQAAKANKNATILLEELDMEKNREESKKAAAARRRERKKKKKLEKKEEKRKLHEENKKNENYDDKEEKGDEETQDEENRENTNSPVRENEKEEGDSGIDANSQGSCSSNEVKSKEKRKDKKKKKGASSKNEARSNRGNKSESKKDESKDNKDKDIKKAATSTPRKNLVFEATKHPAERDDFEATGNEYVSPPKSKKLEYFDPTSATTSSKSTQQTSPKQFIKREEGWKEVVRKSSQPVVTSTEIAGVKKVSVPLNAISRVIGRAGSNINAIRGATGAHIEVEKQSKGQGERIITIKGNGDVVKKAVALIQALIKDPDADIFQLLSTKKNSTTTTLWDKTQMAQIKKTPVKSIISSIQIPITTTQPKSITVVSTTSTRLLVKSRSTVTSSNTRPIAPPRMIAQAEKYVAKLPTSQPNVITTRITTKPITTVATETFAAKLTESTHTLNIAVTSKLPQKLPSLNVQNQPSNIGPVSPLLSSNTTSNSMNQLSPKHQYNRPSSAGSAPPSSHFPVPGKIPFPPTSSSSSEQISNNHRSNTPIQTPISSSIQEEINNGGSVTITMPAPQQYSLFNTVSQQSMFQQSMLRRENEQKNFAAVTGGGGGANQPVAPFIDPETPTVDASKAPGYRGTTVSSPVSSKASSNSTTPPNLNLPTNPNFNQSNQALPPIGTNILHSNRPSSHSSQSNQNDYFSASELTSRNIPHLTHSDTNLYKRQNKNYPTPMNTIALSLSNDPQILHSNLNFSQPQLASSQNLPPQPPTISRLNPKAPDFSSSVHGKYSIDLFNPPSSFQPGSSIGYHPMTKQQIPTFNQQRVPQSASQNRWPMMAQIQPPPYNQQTNDLMISGMAGMTIHGLARVTGGDILENGELGFSNSSPAMSPNLQPQHVIQQENHQEDRKPPPIGTERRKTYPQQPGGDHSWVNVEPKMYATERGWMSSNMERYPPMQQKQMYNDSGIPPLMDTFQGMGMDNSHGYANGTPLPHYYQLQQQPMVNMREYPPNDQIKMGGGGSGGLSWEQSNMDLQDKQQGWPMMATKWNNP